MKTFVNTDLTEPAFSPEAVSWPTKKKKTASFFQKCLCFLFFFLFPFSKTLCESSIYRISPSISNLFQVVDLRRRVWAVNSLLSERRRGPVKQPAAAARRLPLLKVKVSAAADLGRTQPMPGCHHFLWVSHRVLPLLHGLWQRTVEAQLDLKPNREQKVKSSVQHKSRCI